MKTFDLKARVVSIEDPSEYRDGRRRISIRFEDASAGFNLIRFANDDLQLGDTLLVSGGVIPTPETVHGA